MLRVIDNYEEIDERKLMDLYRESNVDNLKNFYPDSTNTIEDLKKEERDYLDYLKNDFFSKNNTSLCVLEKGEDWVSALRLYLIKSRLYYLEALETHPEYRKRGYASRLLIELLELLKKDGSFEMYSCVSKENLASLNTHKKCGFEVCSEEGYDYANRCINEKDYSLVYRFNK